MAMDAKDLRTDSALSAPINDGNASYNPSSTPLQSNRNKSYQDIGSNSLGKVESQTTRPCAIIGPDRVLPPPPASDVYLKKASVDPWSCNENVYRHQPNFMQKLPDYQQVRNISPRETFQENMQRIMVPPSYSSSKNTDDPNSKNSKVDMPLELKYSEVPYTINPVINGQKSIRNSDIPLTNVNPAFTRSVPPHAWANSGGTRPLRPYGAPEYYQYPELSNFMNPRSMLRPHRTPHDDAAQVNAERLYQEGNMRFKPYPSIKERYPHVRYDYPNKYTNTFHPHAPFPPQKYELSKNVPPHPYPMYSQVPMRRIAEPILDSYQRSNQQTNFNPYHNQYIPPPYGSVPGNCIQNKMYSHQSELSAKQLTPNKLPYDVNNKIYLEYENNRNKIYPPVDHMYYPDPNRPPGSKSDVMLPIHPGHMPYNMPPQYMFRKDNIPMKPFDNIHFRSVEQNVHVNSPLLRHPLHFSPSGLVISPADSNTSNDNIQTLQEDCGYVSQSSSASGRSIDSGNYRIQNEMYRNHENFYNSNIRKFPKQVSRSQSVGNSSDKKNLDVRQFLQMWNEGEEEVTDSNNASTSSSNFPKTSETISNQDQLYVLGLVNIPTEELSKYEHIQKISKLPENIKGYNSIELLDQYEQLVESPALRQSKTIMKEYQMSPKPIVKQPPHVPRPISPLDVEAKISQSVIHKEVGCNFEIKPCSPKMLNVEVATPVQNILDERAIEKVINLGIGNSSPTVLPNKSENPITSCKMNSPFMSNNDLMKSSNYIFQDLESNSGVCLASLPRLDSDLELNFPEINQQFIDANNIHNIKPENIPSDTTYTTNLLEAESDFVTDKETPKLSKYRKTKTYDFSPDDIGHRSAMNRTDSVIIKNPDNIRKNEEIQTNVTTIMKENKETDFKLSTTDNVSTLSPLKAVNTPEDCSNTAIDFSFNKINENHDYSSDSKSVLNDMDIEKYDQKVNVSQCNNNNDSSPNSPVKKDLNNINSSNSNVRTEYATEIPLCSPSSKVNTQTIIDEKGNTDIYNANDVKNNDNIKEDMLSEDRHYKTIQANMQITDCLTIDDSDVKENVMLNLPILDEEEKENVTALNTIVNTTKLALSKGNHSIIENTELNLNISPHDQKEKTDYNDQSTAQTEHVQTHNEYFIIKNSCYNDYNDNTKENESHNKDICHMSLNNNVTEESVDKLLEEDNSQEILAVEKECTVLMKHTAEIVNTQMGSHVSEMSDHRDTSHQIISYSKDKQNHVMYDEYVNSDKQICSKDNLCTNNIVEHFLTSTISQDVQSMAQNRPLVTEKTQFESNKALKSLNEIHSMEIEAKTNNNEHGISDENKTVIIQKDDRFHSNYILENEKTFNSENIISTHLRIGEKDLQIPSHSDEDKQTSQIKNQEIEEIEFSSHTLSSQLNKEDNQTLTDVGLETSKDNTHNVKAKYSHTGSHDTLVKTAEVEHSLNNNFQRTADFQEVEEVQKENLCLIKIQEIERAQELAFETSLENQFEIKRYVPTHEQSKKTRYFSSKYFSWRLQNLIIYNEGISKSIDTGDNVSEQKMRVRLIDEGIQPKKLKEDNEDRVEANFRATIVPLGSDSSVDDKNIKEQCNNAFAQNDQDICDNYNDIKHTKFSEDKITNNGVSNRRTLKRSLSDSAIASYTNNTTDHSLVKEPKRRRLIAEEILETPEDEEFSSFIQNHRRNSISTICNNQNLFILIDNDEEYVIAQDEDDNTSKICFTEVSTAFCNSADAILNLCVSNESEEISFTESFTSDILESNGGQTLKNDAVRDTWVEDIACIETVFNDDVAEDIIISAPTSPNSLSRDENYDESSTCSESEIDHMVKVKEIYGNNLCVDDVQLVETLYKTPQMNVNKTLVDIESHNGQEVSNDEVCSPMTFDDEAKSPKCDSLPQSEHYFINNDIKDLLDNKENKIHKSPSYECNFTNVDNNLDSIPYEKLQEYSDCVVDSCDISVNKYNLSENQDHNIDYATSRSPEVSSTTSEEKGSSSSILLKITSVNGSRRSQINNVPDISNNSYKLSEIKDYTSNFRPLITKAAKKYIPPLKETQDLKVKLALPQQSLNKLKQLKLAKDEPFIQKINHVSNPIRHDFPKKIKPKFEDVLKSIDEIQFKRHKENSKKTKHSIPKVVIKKNENGAHYASSSNKKKSYNPDLTGRKWQPWVFIERNEFVDKMAQRNKVKAVYCHRKKTFVLAEKFKKYKSICTAKFVISQPTSDNASSGNLKYTIRLKHNY
ncbi:putative uncharacterized protein DDB_G0282133 [Zerene cesonia]|uniref:putative uncharacterized protein DDB_G0282133 n=1 Tax=Zerene cesonia TaxID=33412 RepID=UPI0018E5868A|nr:putative uncharacterized protein DDB_G0282133 [Zerene cesonia]XP_038208422.1 putative uncharacterized protein DDB_G0282133 [Zerene cesonia]